MKKNSTKAKSILFLLVAASISSYAYLNLVDLDSMPCCIVSEQQEELLDENAEVNSEVNLPDVELIKKVLDLGTHLLPRTN